MTGAIWHTPNKHVKSFDKYSMIPPKGLRGAVWCAATIQCKNLTAEVHTDWIRVGNVACTGYGSVPD